MANVLIYAPFANWNLHYATDMELTQNCLDRGDIVCIVQCDASLPICEPDPTKMELVCSMCKARRDIGLKWLDGKNIEVISLNLDTMDNTQEINDILKSMKSVDDVRSFSIDGNDLGMAAVSSTVTRYREPELLWEKHSSTLLSHLRTALLVYNRFKILLASRSYDKVILFNGRYSTFRPVLRLVQQMNVSIYVHERGPEFNQYSLTKNTYPHSIRYVEDQILKYAEDETSQKEKERIGSQWFIDRQKHAFQNWTVYTKKQKDGYLPMEMSKHSFKIAIFNSSEDEMVAIEEWQNPYYLTQNEGIEKILADLENDDIHFYLRVHPNLKNIDNSQTRNLHRLKAEYKNLTLIDADSEISTYDLVKAVDMVITLGSSVGIEASFMNVPSIVMGKNPYLILDTCIQPINHKAMLQIIKDFKEKNFIPKKSKKSYLYGYYMKSYGKPYKYVRQTGVTQARLVKDGKETILRYSIKILFIWLLLQVRKAFLSNKKVK
jgi:hypothetical protein